ncbi:hypothetical protein JXI42_00320 [bacterium]|nr:hypothetical protein [bacterium]
MNTLNDELQRSFSNLKNAGEAPLYFMSYGVTEITNYSISASNGALNSSDHNRKRYLDVDVRVGDIHLDNTHEIRGYYDWGRKGGKEIAIEDDVDAIKTALWLETDAEFKEAQKLYTKIKANIAVKVEEEDKSDDFSIEEANVYIEPVKGITLDQKEWEDKLCRISALFKESPIIHYSSVSLSAKTENRYFVNSEGTKIQTGRDYIRLGIYAATKADDGMDLSKYQSYDVASLDELPSEQELAADVNEIIRIVTELREAPLVEPFAGPAIMMNKACGVFFHEIFGHRVEGHRLKSEENGQTFKEKIGDIVMPDFINIYDDPNQMYFNGVALNGYYQYDDEGVKAERVDIIKNGILEDFLMCRSPLTDFTSSNGHGRREYGHKVVSRQGNLFVEATETVSYDELKKMLIEECIRQDKEYGLVFEDISGGFTFTGRGGPQAFKVKPVVVYRVYADGRPDELVRGVDIVGTPLSSLTKITASADDYGLFNGYCGAESGSVPVSAVAPSLLVTQIEVEKRRKSQDKPPILPPPYQEGKSE